MARMLGRHQTPGCCPGSRVGWYRSRLMYGPDCSGAKTSTRLAKAAERQRTRREIAGDGRPLRPSGLLTCLFRDLTKKPLTTPHRAARACPEVRMSKIRFEPAVILYGVNALVTLLVAYGLDLTLDQVASVTTITTAVLTIVAAALTRPVVVSTITAAVGTLLAAVAAWGLDLTADQIGATVTALSIALALLLRQNVSPVTASRPPV